MHDLQLIFLCGSVAVAAILTAWGLSSAWRVERALAAGLDRTLDALRPLQFDRVETPARHEEIRGLVIEAEGVFPVLEQAWIEFEETLVLVEGQPRAPQAAPGFFAAGRLSSGQVARLPGVLDGDTLDVLPVVLATLGVLGAVAVLGAGLVDASAAPTDGAAASMARAIAAALGYAALPLAACLGLRVAFRLIVQNWRGQLAQRVELLVRWVDGHYRTVTSVELLARLLSQAGDSDTGPLPVGGASLGGDRG